MTEDAARAVLARMGTDLPEDVARLALTHRSYAYENGGLPTNERLEFLGDMVLGLAVTERLYREHPDRDEHRLATWRAAVVSTKALADVAREIGLGPAVLLGKGEEQTGGRDKDSILADALEALFGAVYVHHGADVALACVRRTVGPWLDEVVRSDYTGDWKTTLLELATAEGRQVTYTATSEGPDHERLYTVVVEVEGRAPTNGTGRSKKAAEQAAARAMCRAWQPAS